MKLSGTGIEGMGFAIPISSTTSIYEQLISDGKVKRPFIGITGIDLDEETAKANKLVQGIYVRAVEDFSSAQKADIRNGDVIIEADGKKVTTMDELNEIKNTHSVGDTMTLKINRDGKEINVDVVLGETP
ncbi:MAG: PDZ domain-containing protein [Clostridia bacterium]|nr:PDZ domain-containing protein [Clostridia bacterium]